MCLKKYHEDYRSACKLFSNLYLLITMLEVLFFNLQCNYDKASLAKSIPKFNTECLVAPCKGIWILQSTKFQNPGLWNPESCKWLESGIQETKNGIKPCWESGIPWAGIRNPVPGIRSPQCGMPNPRLSWIPLHGASLIKEQKFTNKNKFLRLLRFLIK